MDKVNDFLKDNLVFVQKPIGLSGGRGIKKLYSTDFDIKDIQEQLSRGGVIIEGVLEQAKALSIINPSSVNTIRIATMIDGNGIIHVPCASLRIGRKGKNVDNFCAGGLVASIDMETGRISSEAFDKYANSYKLHPDTKIKFMNYQLPYWDDIISTVKEAAKRVPKCRYIGWDVAIRNDGKICLIEGNTRAEARLFQIPQKRGLRKLYEKYLGKW